MNKTTSLHDSASVHFYPFFYIRGKQEEPLPWKIFLHVPSSDLLSSLLNKGTRYGKDFSTFPRFLTVVPDLYTDTFIWTIGFKLKANQTVFFLSCPQYSVPKNLFINILIKVNHKFLVNLRILVFLFVETKRENLIVCRKYQFSVLVLKIFLKEEGFFWRLAFKNLIFGGPKIITCYHREFFSGVPTLLHSGTWSKTAEIARMINLSSN